MTYKKCPKCELNYITDDEELCAACSPQIKIASREIKVATDFSHIVCGYVYGGNSRKIYEKFCDTLGWDKSKANQFGWQTPLYAKNVDSAKMIDVWFIFYPNYDSKKLVNAIDDYHIVNLIQNDGDRIIEIFDGDVWKTNNVDTLVFVKTSKYYEFLGVYKVAQADSARIYKRISDNYPIKR